MDTSTLGTAALAKVFLTTLALSNPTTVQAAAKPEGEPVHIVPATKITSHAPNLTLVADTQAFGRTVVPASDKMPTELLVAHGERATTPVEKLIGEIRSWVLLNDNWDGEGAIAPLPASLRESVAFVRLLRDIVELPDPMLLSDGHAGLFWKTDGLYADLEFLGDGRVAYFIELDSEGKHKGVVRFDSEKMPAVFPALLRC